MRQELPNASKRKQPLEDARIAEQESGGSERHTQVLETLEALATTTSLCNVPLLTRHPPSQLEILTTRLHYASERLEGNNLRESEADANFDIGRRILGLPCLSPSKILNTSQCLEIQCASCEKGTQMIRAYACTQCLRGVCQICVTRLMAKKWTKRKCPWCSVNGAQFKPNYQSPSEPSLVYGNDAAFHETTTHSRDILASTGSHGDIQSNV
ncbi:hypothetical protein B0J14DRAFT_187233 [Halenospora varia]|nr:hypothetical protein B0J14DRAFT_187233 [Halenospora varia]